MTDVEVFSFLYAKSKFRMDVSWRLRNFSVWFVIFCTALVLLPRDVRPEGSCSNDSQCGAGGICDVGECLCAPGWSGDTCQHCNGRTRLDDISGYIVESIQNYPTATKCTWLIDGGGVGATIRLIPEDFGTECSWDYLFIYDGDSIYSPLVASLNGLIRHSIVDIRQEIVTTSGYAYLYFYSDAAFTIDGFNISYSIDTCPGNNCNGHGSCNETCSCDSLWVGEACGNHACPSNCSGRGYCNQTLQSCVCQDGYKGRDCATLAEDGLWELKEGAVETGLASATSVLISDDLWVIGGYAYTSSKNISVVRYNIPLGTSEVLPTESESGEMPRSRYAHSTVHFQDRFIMFGGSYQGRGVSSELWSLHYPTLTWSNMTSSPYLLEGHTAHMVDDVMVVIFGYSPVYGYINSVQEFNLTSETWTLVAAQGAPVKGGYGHSSVYDEAGKRIYVHGGYKLNTGSDHTLSDDTYQYNLVTKSWVILRESGFPKFFHSSVILDGQMLVFGGNTHTDGTKPTGAQCYSSDFLAYNLECGTWETVELSSGLENEVSRFGHGAFTHQGSMWIYSGYNGLLTTSALLYNPGNCSVINNSSKCVEGLPGLWCAWDMVGGSCLPIDSIPGLANNHSTCPINEGAECVQESSCESCVIIPGCGWCNGNCSSRCENEVESLECPALACDVHTNCRMCNSQANCSWKSSGKCSESNTPGDPNSCEDLCYVHGDCGDCLSSSGSRCMWCQSQGRCIDSNAYMTSFPYGLCLEWRTKTEGCPSTCGDYMTCHDCQGNPACGWCDGGHRNGLGRCMAGGYLGPVNAQDSDPTVDYDQCPSERWYFVDCPSCQCNGHSQCPQNSSECGLCQDNTEGNQCETCELGYYGQPQNGGMCSLCSCNDQSDVCHQTTGYCYCEAKGVVGKRCERCDTNNKYYGDPQNGGYCYYNLLMNWQYTFNLSEEDDKNHTRIAMMTTPDSANRDIEFVLEVSQPVYLNITFTANYVDGEQTVVDGRVVESKFNDRFSRWDYDFSTEGNTTFFFYLSNFTTPLQFKVTQYHPFFNWVTVLVAFFVCFFTMLLLFLVGIKVKDRYDRYHRTRQRAVEMAVMASRPFSTVNLEVSKSAPPDLVAECQNYQLLAAMEPCSDSKAGVMTVFIQLPMPDGERPPFGQPRLALASALIQLKHKKSEQREQRQRERENKRERERENRAQEQETRAQEQETAQTTDIGRTEERPSSPRLPAAPLADMHDDDSAILTPDEVPNHIYENPAMNELV